MKKVFFFLAAVAVFGGSSCIKSPPCPAVPAIEFKNFTILGDSALLEFSFEDGDGDIGLKESETNPPYDYNLYLSYFEKVNGEFKENTTLDPPFWYRVPYLHAENSNRCVSGNVQVNISPFYRDFLSPESDTVMFRIYLVDRALNKSNIIETPEIITP